MHVVLQEKLDCSFRYSIVLVEVLTCPLVSNPGSVMKGFCRQTKRGGGVVLYIREDYTYKIRDDICIKPRKLNLALLK